MLQSVTNYNFLSEIYLYLLSGFHYSHTVQSIFNSEFTFNNIYNHIRHILDPRIDQSFFFIYELCLSYIEII